MIIVTSEGKDRDSLIDQRFGRCKYFLVFDGDEFRPVENEGAIQGHGAGIRAAQQVAELGADAVITGEVGPNAKDALDKLGIKAYSASGAAEEAVRNIEDFEEISETAEPHSGEVAQKDGKRIFFPLLDDNGLDSQISPHFGHAPYFGLYDSESKEFTVTENSLSHNDPNKTPVDQIMDAVNPDMIFAHGIGARAIGLFAEKGIAVRTGPFDVVRHAIENMDMLKEQSSDCGHHHNHDC